jgi:DNA-binding NarL/FixJ family response regulator
VDGDIRLVLVEDNQTFRETLELLLPLHAGIEVVASLENGADAVDVCARLTPDVAVIDYRMPGLDGPQTTAAIRAASPRTRVVCLTASVTRAELERVRSAGAAACLTKDQSLDEIVAAIRAVATAP